MPVNYSNYADDWFTRIRPSILNRASNRCEFCGVNNHLIGYRDALRNFIEIPELTLVGRFPKGMYVSGFKVFKIILSIAHLDHNPNNNNFSNLKALCQKCHLNYDAMYHQENRFANRLKSGKSQNKITRDVKKNVLDRSFFL